VSGPSAALAAAGREWRARGQPRPVQVHDSVQPALGRAIPYGVYDVGANTGWVSVGIHHDTAAFAVASIRRWWQAMERRAYPRARRLLITADAGRSTGARLRLWKVELQKLADVLRQPITVCHFPPGTSKWNTIEHRLFSFISQNWRGRPLLSHTVIVSLIAATSTRTGLRVRACLDTHRYPWGLKVSRDALAAVRLRPDAFHGDWSYTILPRPSAKRQDLVQLFCCGPLDGSGRGGRRRAILTRRRGTPPRSFRGRLGLDPSEQSIWRCRFLLPSMPSYFSRVGEGREPGSSLSLPSMPAFSSATM
jgi:DDE family transposase